MDQRRRKNIKVVAALGCIIVAMTVLVSYSVPLYRLFCSATGWTTQRADADNAAISDRTVVVRFTTSVAPDLPWRFEPVQREVKLRLGEEKLVFFTAQNLSDKPIVAHATFNVTPTKVGSYFNKIQCFCFDEERLAAGEAVQMPVDFFVDPDLDKDSNAKEVDTITLSYTFFRSVDPENAKDLSRFSASASPDPSRGAGLFAERCATCHALDRNGAGPMLGGVLERKAGTAAGYHYSTAVQNAGVTWSAENLDKWLTDPRKFIPGTRMPIRVLDANTRRDIIAYLERESGKLQGKPGSTASAR